MIRNLQFRTLLCVITLLAGCTPAEPPIWEQVKISDLAKFQGATQKKSNVLKTINLNVRVIEIPAEKIEVLDNIWQVLHKGPLRFRDMEAFEANSFSAGYGQLEIWDKIAVFLRSAGGKQVRTVSLLLFDGESENITATRLYNEQAIWYYSYQNSLEGITAGPGKLVLRIKAEKVPGSRGLCRVYIKPVIPSLSGGALSRLSAAGRINETIFYSAGIELEMGRGDFIFLGPKEYIDNQVTLGGLLFSRPNRKPKPVVRVFLIVCTNVVD